ncbi:hypothetical protein AGMMS50262_06580 [Bacteroidia bacterium]|nr:hypothetical protein AGMMS50262_06580 [Bacteroidia bacterium]
MRTIKFLTLFFLFLPISAFAQWDVEQRMPFEASTTWDNVETRHATSLQSGNDFLWQSDFLYRDLHADLETSLFNPSGDFLTNIWSDSYQRAGGGTSANPPQGGEPNSGVPVGNGLLVFLICSIFYFLIILKKMKTNKVKTITLVLLLFASLQAYADDTPIAYSGNLPAGTTLTIRLEDIGAIPTECNAATPIITTLNDPAKGTLAASRGKIVYESTLIADTMQTDQFVFYINCNGGTYTVTTNLNIVPKPDNVIESNCFDSIRPFNWEMQTAFQSADANNHNYAIPLVGDIDGDGISEIITLTGDTDNPSSFMIYPGNNRANLKTITVNHSIYQEWAAGGSVCPYGMCKTQIGGVDTYILVTTSKDGYLYAYDLNGATSQNELWSASFGPGYSLSISFADFDNDGHPEIYVGNKIYDAATGNLLVSGSGNTGLGYFAANLFSVIASMAADMNGDGKLELVCGTEVYAVDIPNKTGTSGNSLTLIQKLTGQTFSNGTVFNDACSTIADINQDGKLDIINWSNNNVSSKFIVWDFEGDTLLCSFDVDINMNGFPMIGNIDTDPALEIVFMGNGGTFLNSLAGYKPDFTTKTATQTYNIAVTDVSGMTGMTLFDFNQDGINEILYRDEQNMRVLNANGNTFIERMKMTCGSTTFFEYPVIADVDGDGAAEIIVVGNTYGASNGYLWIFNSAQPWAPARSVWNQYAYNAVNVNDDLTIPKYQLNPATVFAGTDQTFGTTDDVRPYNAFLQQQTTINQYGVPFVPAPDLSFATNSSGKEYTVGYNAARDSIRVNFCVTNSGEASITGPISFALYKNSVSPANSIDSARYTGNINVNDTVCLTMHFKAAGMDFNNVIISLNDYGSGFILPECDTINNRTMVSFYNDYYGIAASTPSALFDILNNDAGMAGVSEMHIDVSPVLTTTAGSTLGIKTTPSGIDSLIYTPKPGFVGIDTLTYSAGGQVNTGNVYVYVLEDSIFRCIPETVGPDEVIEIDFIDMKNDVEVHFFQPAPDNSSANELTLPNSWNGTTITFPLQATVTFNASKSLSVTAFNNKFPVTYKISLVPELMYWNWTPDKTANNNWNNPANWLDEYGNHVNAVPLACTTVHIPGNAAYYPILDSLNTVRNHRYGEPECDNIIFHFGGEVAQLNYLTYTKAFVQYNVGYYGDDEDYDASPVNGDSIDNRKDGTLDVISAEPMNRSQWYGLAIPLKKVATGDFSFGGKPHTWQMSFICQPHDGIPGTWTGDFTVPFNTNGIELNNDYAYSYAFWANRHQAGEIGSDGNNTTYQYQSGLQGVKGIIELPFYEKPAISTFHRNHIFTPDGSGNPSNGASSFWYYQWYQPSQPRDYNVTPGTIQRDRSAYRFIFDEKIDTVNIGGTDKAVFTMRVPAGSEIMVGNPYLSSLDFTEFYNANSTKIENRYRLFEDETFNVYSLSDNDTIAVLQGFFIKTTGTVGDSLDLYFPFETVSVTRAISSPHDNYFKAFKGFKGLNEDDRITVTATSNGKSNKARLNLSQENGNNIYKLFYEEAQVTPQIYFTDERGQKNEIQYAAKESQTTVPLGLRSNQGRRITLTFDTDANLEMLTLLDKKTGQKQDLLQNNSYTFTQSDNAAYSDRFEVSFKSPTAIGEIKNENKIAIYQTNNLLTVSATENLQSVELLDIQGRKIKKAGNINHPFYQMELNVPAGVYLVKADATTHKIIVK